MRLPPLVVFIASVCSVIPNLASAQSAITGVVKDGSGAVMPGVIVEATSDALIERVRTVTTDGEGQYKVVDLRPGVYAVTFTLAGFQTVKRDGVDLPTNFTATINAEMRVGALEETVIVTGGSPLVDVQTAVHTQVLNQEALESIPTGHTIQSLGQLIIGVNLSAPDVAGTRAMQQAYMSTHGLGAANNTYQLDGMSLNGNISDGIVTAYFNDAMNQEISYQTSGISAEVSGGGVRMNMIPKEGGNRFSGSFYSSDRPRQWQGNNLTQRLKDGGLTTVNAIDKLYDVNGSEGGPLKRDRLWFFTAARFFRFDAPIADALYKDGRQGIDDQYLRNALVRLTWQVSPRNKMALYYDRQGKFRGHDMTAGTDPATAAMRWVFPMFYDAQAKWTSTVSNKLMIDAGYSSFLPFYTVSYQPGIAKQPFTPEWYATASRVDLNVTTRTTAGTNIIDMRPELYHLQTSASYVTGSHNIKVGYQVRFGTYRQSLHANADLVQQYRSGTPDSVLVMNTPLDPTEMRVNSDSGIYAQDSWTLNRLTLNYGLRWERLNAEVTSQNAPRGRFVPARHFDTTPDLPNWSDFAPRFSAVFDVFGNTRTAFKYSLNRYNQSYLTGIASKYNPLALATSSLRWTDLNKDDIASGDLGCVYLAAGCEIDYSTLPANFGTRSLNTFGDYPRPWTLEHGLELQHQLTSTLSVSAATYRSAFHNLTTTRNTLLSASDYSPIEIFSPLDGQPITIYNLSSAKASAVANLDTVDALKEQHFASYEVGFKLRMPHAFQVFGGVELDRTLIVDCNRIDDPNTLRFCDARDNGIPYNKQFKVAGSVPWKWGIQLSGAFQSNPGTATNGGMTYAITRTTRYPANCPAPCPAGALVVGPQLTRSTQTISLAPQGTVFTERIDQLDLKVMKTFKVQQFSLQPTFEVFNALNADAVIAFRSVSYATQAFLQPSSVLQARIVGVGLQMRW